MLEIEDQSHHLLSKHKILKEFNISRKIKNSYVKSIYRKLQKQGLKGEDLDDKVNRQLMENTQRFIGKNKIPGFYHDENQNVVDDLDDELKQIIYELAAMCIEQSKLQNFNKEHHILFTQLYLHLSRVTNDDIKKFKEKYNVDNDETNDNI